MSLPSDRSERPLESAGPEVMQLNIAEIREDLVSSISEIRRRLDPRVRLRGWTGSQDSVSTAGAAVLGLAAAALLTLGAIVLSRRLRGFDG